MIYLASQSPRRAALLTQLGVRWQTLAVTCDETPQPGEAAPALVQRLARAKAQAGWRQLGERGLAAAPVLGADTLVLCQGRIMGKPADRADYQSMLTLLAAHPHQVLTSVAVVAPAGEFVADSVSQVRLRALSAEEIDAYWATGEPRGKAGGYAIQGAAAAFVAHLEGSYSGVMGLPLCETAQLLHQAGVAYWQYPEVSDE